ncbi:MAG: type II secretion system protein GspC [Gammaproteobacteria bacterium]|nr:type II secretion system protein GspC [Gammaproteobacteria bacterium]
MMRPALDWKKAWEVFFLDAVQRRIILLVQVVLVLMLAATLAQLTWKVIPLPARSLAPPPEVFRGAVAPGDQKAGGVLWDLAKWHLFGEKPVGAALPAVESLPETQLNLTLSGVVASSGATGGGAIIAAPGGSEAFYTINAQLPGGAILKEVHPDRVVLERNGRLETLRLPKEGLGNLNGATPAGDSGQAGQSRVTAARGGTGSENAPPPANLREFRDRVLADPQSASNLVQINPKSADGRFLGYELQPGQDAGLFTRAGLSPGDIVTSVNGVRLDSPAKALSLLRGLSSADEIRLEVERDGVPQSLIVNINQ